MIIAKDAYAKTKELIQKDADALNAKCNEFIENIVQTEIITAIEARQSYCGLEIPKGLKQSTSTIKKKLEEYGYAVAVTHGYVNCITVSWNNCE